MPVEAKSRALLEPRSTRSCPIVRCLRAQTWVAAGEPSCADDNWLSHRPALERENLPTRPVVRANLVRQFIVISEQLPPRNFLYL